MPRNLNRNCMFMNSASGLWDAISDEELFPILFYQEWLVLTWYSSWKGEMNISNVRMISGNSKFFIVPYKSRPQTTVVLLWHTEWTKLMIIKWLLLFRLQNEENLQGVHQSRIHLRSGLLRLWQWHGASGCGQGHGQGAVGQAVLQ